MSLFKPRASLSYQEVWGSGDDWRPLSTSSGEHVSAATALGLTAVWSCVDLLARVVASLPVDVFEDTASGPRPVDAPAFVSDPSLRLSRREWVHQGMVSLLIHGNAYGVTVARDRDRLRPRNVEWLDPVTVSVDEPNALALPIYRVGQQTIDSQNLWHLRAFSMPGSAVGVSPLEYQRETFGLGLAARKFGAQFFAGGGHPTSILTSDQPVDQESATTIKSRFLAALSGKRGPAVLGLGIKYNQVQVGPNESQFLETQDRIVAEVARAYGVPPEMIGHVSSGRSSLTYANREQRSQDFLAYTVGPWLLKFEDAITKALPDGQYAKFNTGALLRSDLKSRYEAYEIGRRAGFLTTNEVRALEDRTPLPGGDNPTPPSSGGDTA